MVHGTLLVFVFLLAQTQEGGLVARWKFDGDVKDSGPATLPTKAAGRMDFIDSPIGASGPMAVRNGETRGAGNVRAADFDLPQAPLLIGRSLEEGKVFSGFLDDVRLYARALDAEESTQLTGEGIPWLRPKPHAKTPFPGKFELVQD